MAQWCPRRELPPKLDRRVNRTGLAEEALRDWAEVHAKRDEVILAALDAGVSAHQVQRLTGVARTTIARIQASR